jgi:predicted nucleic acid-binding protein
MPASDKVLIDTSVWIDFFRKTEPVYSFVMQLIAGERVCSAGIIIAELMQGAKSEKELTVLKDFIHVFEILPESSKIWQTAGELSFHLRRKGKTIGLSDCFIAVSAREGNAAILTMDNHFEMMKSEAKIRLISFP